MSEKINHFLDFALKNYNENDYEYKDGYFIVKKNINKDFYSFFEHIVSIVDFHYKFVRILITQKHDKVQISLDNKFNANIEKIGFIDENGEVLFDTVQFDISSMLNYIEKTKKANFLMNIDGHGFFKIDFNSYCDIGSYEIYNRADDIYISIEVQKINWTVQDVAKNKQIGLLSDKKEILLYEVGERVLLPLKYSSMQFEIENVEYFDFKDSIKFKSKSISNHDISRVNFAIARLWDIDKFSTRRERLKAYYYLSFNPKGKSKYNINVVVDFDYDRFDLESFIELINEDKTLFVSSIFDLVFENLASMLFEQYGISDFNRGSDLDEILEIINCSTY